MGNHLHYGDNLEVLRNSISDESVDLIYLDPPFNSNANYSHLFKDESGQVSGAQIEAFEDTWHWDDMVSGRALTDLRDSPYQSAADMLDAMVGFLGKNPMTAYLTMMGVRLVELHRVLKPTGSLYLHCDPTASHYLKILLDAVFGAKNYKNEIVWRRTGSHNSTNRFGPIHDVIHFYTKDQSAYRFRRNTRPYTIAHVEKAFKQEGDRYRTNYSGNVLTGSGTRNGLSGNVWKGIDPTVKGRHWALPSKLLFGIEKEFEGLNQTEKFDKLFEMGIITVEDGLEWPKYQRYITAEDGQYLSDIWAYQPGTEGVLFETGEGIDQDVAWLGTKDQERLGYPTQKPVALLERILKASSNEGDVVLDPFCGCGTTVHAAQKLNRKWIGIDITHLAIGLIETRLYDAFGEDAQFKVHGVPQDIAGAQDFFDRDDRTKKEFEKWAVRLIKAYSQSGGKKGADGGIDGIFRFGRDKEHKAIVSVKGGKNLGVAMIRDLDAVVTEQKAQIGIFLTLHKPTKPMVEWAKGAGTFEVEGFDPVPRLQIVTIEQALKDGPRTVDTPLRHGSPYKKAAKEQDTTAQGRLDI